MELEKWYPLVLASLVAVCYHNCLSCDFVYDDLAAVRNNRDLRPHTPITNIFRNDFWGTPLTKEQSHKSYRPLTVLSFRLNYAAHGLDPFGYHLLNILLHALVCLLFYRLCLHFVSVASSIVSSTLFAVHPIHTEAVCGVVGRAELLSAIAFLCALLLYVNNDRKRQGSWQKCFIASLLAIVGLLCKEQAVTVLAVCCVYELANVKNVSKLCWKDNLQRIVILLVATSAILYLRWKIIGPQFPIFSRFDNPAAVSKSPTRQLTFNYLLSVNAWLLLFPFHLCCDWTMSTIPLVTTLWDIRNLATVILYLGVFCIARSILKMEEDSRMATLLGMSIVILPFLPASNLFFPVGFVIAERVLYIPSMGFCMLVGQGWDLFWKRSRRKLALFGILFLLTIHIFKTIDRNKDWQTEYTLYDSALAINRRNGKLLNNMGRVLESMNRHEEALEHYNEAILIQPDDVRSYLNVGRVLTNLNRYKEAEEIYLKAKQLFPAELEPKNGKDVQEEKVHVTISHLQIFVDLAFLISQNGSRLEEADALYKEAISLRSDFTDAYLNRGDVLLKMNKTKEAEAMYHIALQYDEGNPDLYFNLGVVLMDQGRNSEALELFDKALDLEPDHEKSLELSTILMHESNVPNHRKLARNRLEKIINHGKETERMYINLGLVAVENKNFQSAEKWFKKALIKHPNSRESLFNLALLLSDQGRQSEALLFLNQLLQHYPSHINGLLLIADINVNYLKNLDAAEECYRKVLEQDPGNQRALHNWCVVHFERRDLEAAEKCFVRASALHPGVPYIRHHLDVVRDVLERKRDGLLGQLQSLS